MGDYTSSDAAFAASVNKNPSDCDGFVYQGSQGKTGWYDAFQARHTIFPDGQQEILIQREKHFAGPALCAVPKAKRGESADRERSDEESVRRAKKQIRHKCKMIGADRMLTLTTRENIQDRATAILLWKAFVSRMRKHKAFLYVSVMEVQKRGAIHFHVAVRGRQSFHLVRSVWRAVLGGGEGKESKGNVHVRNPSDFGFGRDGLHRLAGYISKYVSKQLEVRDINEKRYFCSRGIPAPEIRSWRLASGDMISAAQAAFSVALEGEMKGLQMYCNNGLGLVWLSSAPGRSCDINKGVPF